MLCAVRIVRPLCPTGEGHGVRWVRRFLRCRPSALTLPDTACTPGDARRCSVGDRVVRCFPWMLLGMLGADGRSGIPVDPTTLRNAARVGWVSRSNTGAFVSCRESADRRAVDSETQITRAHGGGRGRKGLREGPRTSQSTRTIAEKAASVFLAH